MQIMERPIQNKLHIYEASLHSTAQTKLLRLVWSILSGMNEVSSALANVMALTL